MELGRRDLKRDDWNRIIEKEIIIEDIKNDYMEGKVCFLSMIKVSSPLAVDSPIGKVTIADNGYKNLIFAPKNKHWWLTIMFDDKDNLIESYFDITKENNFSDEFNPYFIDMKLDICIPSGDNPYIMDEDELKEALRKGLINQDEYNIAYETAHKIIDTFNNNKDTYYKYIWSYYNKFNR